MRECVFCNIVKTGNNNNEKEKNVILYEDNLVLITQATGSPVRGYLMIVTKRHINGFAELSKEELKHIEKLINIIKEFYKKYFHIDSILLEHGSTSFVNWTSLSINVPNNERNEINNKVRRIGLEIVDELGFTAYGVSASLLKITKCIEEDKRELLPVSTYLKDYDIFISTPSVIGKDGVYENNKVTFDEVEKLEFAKSVNKIKKKIKKI